MSYEIYQARILDHYKHPRNVGELVPADFHAAGSNRVCGDELAIYIRLGSDGHVADVKFRGRGCAISQASASMLTERLAGKTPKDLHAIDRDFVLGALGVPLNASRLECALLPLLILRQALGVSTR